MRRRRQHIHKHLPPPHPPPSSTSAHRLALLLPPPACHLLPAPPTIMPSTIPTIPSSIVVRKSSSLVQDDAVSTYVTKQLFLCRGCRKLCRGRVGLSVHQRKCVAHKKLIDDEVAHGVDVSSMSMISQPIRSNIFLQFNSYSCPLSLVPLFAHNMMQLQTSKTMHKTPIVMSIDGEATVRDSCTPMLLRLQM